MGGELMRRKIRLISMLVTVILAMGTIAGSVHAAETTDGRQSPESIEGEKYKIVLDANGGYFEREWDDLREEYVEKEEIVNKVIAAGEAVIAVPVMEKNDAEVIFLGWSKERNGDMLPREEDGGYLPEKDCTLYALWEIRDLEPEVPEEPETPEEPEAPEEPEEAGSASPEPAAEESPESATTAATAMTEYAADTESPEVAATAATSMTEYAAETEPEEAATTATTITTEYAAETEPEEAATAATATEEAIEGGKKEAAKSEQSYSIDYILTIYATSGGMSSNADISANGYGHAWLAIMNNTSSAYDFHGYMIMPGCSMDLGLWGDQALEKDSLGGVFLNRESWDMNVAEVSCASIAVSKESIDRIKDAVPAESYYHDGSGEGLNVHDPLFHNCTTFAVKMWNLVADPGDKFDTGWIDIPHDLEMRIDLHNRTISSYTFKSPKYNGSLVNPGFVYHITKKKELIPIYSLALSETETALRKGETAELQAKYHDREMNSANVDWKSSDTSVATVKNGTVTARKGGTCTITASIEDNWKAECSVTVVSGEIYSVQDLKAVSKYPSDNYVLMKDLDLGNEEWTPIGTSSEPFTGKFDGNGHSVSGLKVSGNADCRGLFGKTKNAEITRLSVYGSVSGHEYVGGIVGLAENSSVSYCVNYAGISGTDQVGGVIGRCYETAMEYCMNAGNVSASGRACGGVTADLYPSGKAIFCLNLGAVLGGNELTGGITGGSTSGTVTSCINAASVSYTGGRAGGIAGDNASYSGYRAHNYFLKTARINAGFSVIGTGSGTIASASDDIVIALKNKILGGVGGNKKAWPMQVPAKRKIVAGQTATISVTGCDGALSFRSSNTSVASVSGKGKVTAKKPGKARITVTAAETPFYKKTSKTVEIIVVPKAPAKVSAVNLSTGIKLSWSKVSGASYYVIYRNGIRIKKIEKASTVTYTDSIANRNGATYTYTVRACSSEGAGGSKKCSVYRLKKPSITYLWAPFSRTMFVVSDGEPKADGFLIQYSRSRLFTGGKKTVTVGKNAGLTVFIDSLVAGKRYYVRVRTYKRANGKVHYSAWSSVDSVRISR